MTNPLVSIIVPVYNAQKGLSRCLESICSQTYQELEIIVLNDGSTDDSLAICEQFRAKDPRIVVVDKENEGVSRTRNAGLTLALKNPLPDRNSKPSAAVPFLPARGYAGWNRCRHRQWHWLPLQAVCRGTRFRR